MQISFGSMIYQGDKRTKTKKQDIVEKEIEKAFDDYKGYINDNDEEITLCGYIKDKTISDVFVKSKKDGNVSIKLLNWEYSEGCYSDELDKAPAMLDRDKRPVEVLLNLKKPLSVIKKQIKDFAERCENFASGYEWQLIKEDEEDPGAQIRKDEALAALREEERFIEEFGTDKFN